MPLNRIDLSDWVMHFVHARDPSNNPSLIANGDAETPLFPSVISPTNTNCRVSRTGRSPRRCHPSHRTLPHFRWPTRSWRTDMYGRAGRSGAESRRSTDPVRRSVGPCGRTPIPRHSYQYLDKALAFAWIVADLRVQITCGKPASGPFRRPVFVRAGCHAGSSRAVARSTCGLPRYCRFPCGKCPWHGWPACRAASH